MLRKADGTLIEKQVGQKAMAESLPVVLASDQSDLPITLAGEAVIIGGQPISVNAAITGQPISANIAATDSASIDAFGRWRTSGTGNRYDLEYIYNKQPLIVDEVTSGGATATHNADSRDVTLAIVNATRAGAGRMGVRAKQTKVRGQMTQFTRINVPLGKDEFNALREISDREYRHPRDQARHLLRCALGLTDPNKHETATPALHGTGSDFVTPHP